MITSESNSQIKEIVRLQKSAKERRKQKLFVAEGIKLVKEAALYSRLQKVYIAESAWEKGIGEPSILECRYEVVADKVFASMSGTVTPQGMLGLVQMPSYGLETILNNPKKSILLLDNLRDPGNLGTIMRTAEGAGMSGVILSRESVDLFNPKVVRSTMGAIFRVPFYYAEDLAETIETLKQNQIPVYGAMMQGSIVYDAPDYRKGAGIVIGSEAGGISEAAAAHLTQAVCIPMEGSLESLNAAVSAAVLMYEIARQKRKDCVFTGNRI
ncbi:RNA methyltransferase [bacterium D16-51]|nr:RNA methyltransferase [bacterium D16-59]RKI59788.1 RNA methyltransferase [bacterium D16-51]